MVSLHVLDIIQLLSWAFTLFMAISGGNMKGLFMKVVFHLEFGIALLHNHNISWYNLMYRYYPDMCPTFFKNFRFLIFEQNSSNCASKCIKSNLPKFVGFSGLGITNLHAFYRMRHLYQDILRKFQPFAISIICILSVF